MPFSLKRNQLVRNLCGQLKQLCKFCFNRIQSLRGQFSTVHFVQRTSQQLGNCFCCQSFSSFVYQLKESNTSRKNTTTRRSMKQKQS